MDRREGEGAKQHIFQREHGNESEYEEMGEDSPRTKKGSQSVYSFFVKKKKTLKKKLWEYNHSWETLDPSRRLHIKENVENYTLDLCKTLNCWFWETIINEEAKTLLIWREFFKKKKKQPSNNCWAGIMKLNSGEGF